MPQLFDRLNQHGLSIHRKLMLDLESMQATALTFSSLRYILYPSSIPDSPPLPPLTLGLINYSDFTATRSQSRLNKAKKCLWCHHNQQIILTIPNPLVDSIPNHPRSQPEVDQKSSLLQAVLSSALSFEDEDCCGSGGLKCLHPLNIATGMLSLLINSYEVSSLLDSFGLFFK
jgi:hypothetical protein